MALVGREPLTRSGDNVCSGFDSLLNGNFQDVSASIVDARYESISYYCCMVIVFVSDELDVYASQSSTNGHGRGFPQSTKEVVGTTFKLF